MRNEIQCEWTLVAGPAEEPITLDDAKKHAVISQADDDALVSAYVAAARGAAETYLARGLFTQTWRIQLSQFFDVVYLPMAAPLQNDGAANPSTAPVITYYDSNGALQTLATSYYTVDTTSEPGRIVRAPDQTWPTTQSDRSRPVVITYVVGWTSTDAIPEIIKQGIRIYVAGLDGDRVGETDRRAAESLWAAGGQVFWREPGCLY